MELPELNWAVRDGDRIHFWYWHDAKLGAFCGEQVRRTGWLAHTWGAVTCGHCLAERARRHCWWCGATKSAQGMMAAYWKQQFHTHVRNCRISYEERRRV